MRQAYVTCLACGASCPPFVKHDCPVVAQRDRMKLYLASIATAKPQSEQAGWMIATARDGLDWGPGDPS